MNEYCLPVEDVVRLNRQLIGRDGNLLDRSKLESALATPLQTFGGEYLHPSALDRAAALLHYLAKRMHSSTAISESPRYVPPPI